MGLLITLAVYCVIPAFKNLHGKIVMSNIVSMAMSTSLVLLTLAVRDGIKSVNILCIIVGFSTYFSFFANFSWMTIMGFDLGRCTTTPIMINISLHGRLVSRTDYEAQQSTITCRWARLEEIVGLFSARLGTSHGPHCHPPQPPAHASRWVSQPPGCGEEGLLSGRRG